MASRLGIFLYALRIFVFNNKKKRHVSSDETKDSFCVDSRYFAGQNQGVLFALHCILILLKDCAITSTNDQVSLPPREV